MSEKTKKENKKTNKKKTRKRKRNGGVTIIGGKRTKSFRYYRAVLSAKPVTDTSLCAFRSGPSRGFSGPYTSADVGPL